MSNNMKRVAIALMMVALALTAGCDDDGFDVSPSGQEPISFRIRTLDGLGNFSQRGTRYQTHCLCQYPGNDRDNQGYYVVEGVFSDGHIENVGERPGLEVVIDNRSLEPILKDGELVFCVDPFRVREGYHRLDVRWNYARSVSWGIRVTRLPEEAEFWTSWDYDPISRESVFRTTWKESVAVPSGIPTIVVVCYNKHGYVCYAKEYLAEGYSCESGPHYSLEGEHFEVFLTSGYNYIHPQYWETGSKMVTNPINLTLSRIGVCLSRFVPQPSPN